MENKHVAFADDLRGPIASCLTGFTDVKPHLVEM